MNKLFEIVDHIPHIVTEVICLKCYFRWIAVRPRITKLVELECPECSEIGFVIETGEQILESEE